MEQSPIHKRLKQNQFESDVQKAILSLLVSADIIKRKQMIVCSARGITHSQYNILRILKGCYPEGYCRKDIIERMLEKAPDVTRLIDALVSDGKAERIQSDIDKRMSLTRITSEGMALIDELQKPMQMFSKQLETLFDSKELAMISELSGRIIDIDLREQSNGAE